MAPESEIVAARSADAVAVECEAVGSQAVGSETVGPGIAETDALECVAAGPVGQQVLTEVDAAHMSYQHSAQRQDEFDRASLCRWRLNQTVWELVENCDEMKRALGFANRG